MKDIQLFDLMATINDAHINDTVKRRKTAYTLKNKTLRKGLQTGLLAAASVCLVLTCVLTINCVIGRTSATEPTDSHTVTDKVVKGGFVIENGTLLSYTGNETELIIPTEVTAITADSFSDSPSAKAVTAIYLGSSVSSIDRAAFSRLSSLKQLTVAEDNPFFVSKDGILGTKDGTLYFSSSSSFENSVAFQNTIETMQNDTENRGKITQIIVGKATIEISIEDDLYANYEDSRCRAHSVSAYGHTKTFEEPIALYGNFYVKFIQTENVFGMTITNCELGTKFFITEDGIYDIPDHTDGTLDEIINVSIMSFELRDDGRIGYIRRPYKYIEMQSPALLSYCVARDEFAKETGYITFENGEIKYHFEKAYTISDLYDMEELFEKQKPLGFSSDCDPDTLDELLEYNSSHYDRAE